MRSCYSQPSDETCIINEKNIRTMYINACGCQLILLQIADFTFDIKRQQNNQNHSKVKKNIFKIIVKMYQHYQELPRPSNIQNYKHECMKIGKKRQKLTS